MAAGMGRHGRFAATIAAVAVCLFLDAGMAFADARLCRQLEAQLASLSSGGRGTQYRKYDKAVATQRAQLQQARARARSAGCGFSLFGRGGRGCSRLNDTIDRMEQNLSALQSKRTQLAGNSGSKRQRGRLLASLDANGCRGKTATRQREAQRSSERTDRGTSLFDQIFNGGVRQLEELDEETPRNARSLEPSQRQYSGGQYRTLCVRSCDGYYFPISPSSSIREFERDQQNCQTMCPGTDVQIYYQDADDENAEAMVSTATGEPYANLPTAFQYRQTDTPRPAQCACNPAKNFSVIAGNPNWRTIDVEAESATSAPASGSILTFGHEPTSSPAPTDMSPATELPPPGERKVRVVGPVFLPDPAGAIDLQAPAPKQVR